MPELLTKRHARTRPMTRNQIAAAIEALDLDCVKFKLMYGNEDGSWSRDKAEAVCKVYRRFLLLCATRDELIVPNEDVDAFWHGHILDTEKYAMDCEVFCGRFLHHYPYSGMNGEEDADRSRIAFEETRRIYEAEFGEAYEGGKAKSRDCYSCMNPSSDGPNGWRPTLPAYKV